MVSFLSRFTTTLMVLSFVGSLLAVPLATKLKSLSVGAREILRRTTSAAPRFVIYQDTWSSSLPSASKLQGYNVYILSFWMTSGAVDMAATWQKLTDSERASYLQEYNAAGISLVVSAFGSTDAPTSSGADPVATANNLATWAIKYGVQGVDIDYEDLNAFNSAKAVDWLTNLTQQLRKQLPQSQYILSHAPLAPWFSPNKWSDGGYLEIHKRVGSSIDWYNIQFYNQGKSEYTTCDGLLKNSTSAWPGSAVFQIAANGVDLDKLVIGKPATSADASNGYMDPSTLASCVAQAHSSKWNAGVMAWEYPHGDSSWIVTVRGNTWPVSASPAPSPTNITQTVSPSMTSISNVSSTSLVPLASSTSSGPSPMTTPSGSGNCAGVSPWADHTMYVRGDKVTYNGYLWTASWWSEGNTPGGASGAWTNNGTCA